MYLKKEQYKIAETAWKSVRSIKPMVNWGYLESSELIVYNYRLYTTRSEDSCVIFLVRISDFSLKI